MRRFSKIYTFAVCGALGGLVGSMLHQFLFLDLLTASLPYTTRLMYLGLLGIFVGAAIGFFPSFAEGLSNYSLRGALRSGLIGGALGGAGGMLALPFAELLHIQLGGGTPGRMIALAFWGLVVGIAEGINGGARRWRGVVGGLTGGAVAGAVLEYLLRSQVTYAASGIVALIIIGLSIALFVSLFVNVLSEAWLEGLPGSKVDGHLFHLSKFHEPSEALLGSDQTGAVFIWIPEAQSRHAAVTLTANGARLRHVADKGETRVDGNPIRERLLRDGDVVEIANARLRYKERRATSKSSTVKVSKPRVATR